MSRHDLKVLSGRVETLLDQIRDVGDDAARERAEALVRAVMDLYAAGLTRTVELAEDGPLLRAMADDELVGGLLLLHDLHPDDVDTRIQGALDRVRPYLGSHAGGIDYLGVDDDGVAHLTLQGSCNGCPSSSVTVTLSVETAVLEAAPEVTSVDVVGLVPEEPSSPLLQIGLRPGLESGHAATTESDSGASSPGEWEHLDLVPGPGELGTAEASGTPLVLAGAAGDGAAYAYLDLCPACQDRLAGGSLDGDVLRCPSCGASYDIRLAGSSVDGTGKHLTPLPLLPDETGWKVAAPAGAPV